MLVSHCLSKIVGNSGTDVCLWLNEEIRLLPDTPFGVGMLLRAFYPVQSTLQKVRVSVYRVL